MIGPLLFVQLLGARRFQVFSNARMLYTLDET